MGVQLMKELGVTMLYFAAVGATVKDSFEYIFNLVDACDVTTMHSLPDSSPEEFLTELKPFNSSLKILDNCKCHEASFFQFTGPSFPTPSEQNFATLSNATIIGITNVQIVFAARAAGIDVAGMAAKVYSLPDFNEENAEQGYKRVNTLLGNCVLAHEDFPEEKAKATVKPLVSCEKQVGYELGISSQGNAEKINEMIKTLSAFGPEAALVVYNPLF